MSYFYSAKQNIPPENTNGPLYYSFMTTFDFTLFLFIHSPSFFYFKTRQHTNDGRLKSLDQ